MFGTVLSAGKRGNEDAKQQFNKKGENRKKKNFFAKVKIAC